jgi:5-methylcytosine-specific restriction endonuclease McrA
MRTLSPPEIDEIDLYDRLQARRRRGTADVLAKARATVLDAYTQYKPPEVCGLSTVIENEDTAEKLRSNYQVLRSGALAGDGARILARSRICCLCGLRATSQLDHYLPQQEFPEFAVYTVNLVPACGVCNNLKDELYKTGSGDPAFVHAYFDALPESETFLRATLKLDQGVSPSFKLVQTPGLPDDTFRVLTAQFNYFDLDTIYSEEAVELLAEKYGAIEDYFIEGGQRQVAKYLHREAQSVRGRLGLNHWKSAILTAAAGSADFCAWGFRLLNLPDTETHTADDRGSIF